ncbi:hypothetical protein EIM50_24765, partial [Pseudoxanthomonas sp. SGD-10]
MKVSLRKLLPFIWLVLLTLSSNAQHWPPIAMGNQVSENKVSYTSIVTADVSTESESYMSAPHIAYTENKIAKVKRYIAGEWQSVGGNISAGNSSYTYLFTDDRGTLYLNYVDESTNGQRRLAIKTFNSETNNWQALGNSESNLYVSTGSILNDIGNSALVTSHNSWMAFDKDNTPYVIFSEFGTNSGRPVVKKFSGNAWVTVGSTQISTDKATSVGIAFDHQGTTPYITYAAGTGSTGDLKLYRYTNDNWQNISIPAQVNGSNTGQTTGARHPNIVIDQNNQLFIAYFNSGNDNKATIIKYTIAINTWSFSQAISTRDSPNITAIKAQNNDLYVSFADWIANKSGRTVARVFKLSSGSTSWT